MWLLFNNVIIAFSACLALYFYQDQKHTNMVSAARTIKSEIDRAQAIIDEVRKIQKFDFTQRQILTDDSWTKHRHLFSRKISSKEFELFNNFFDACKDIDDSRMKLQHVFERHFLAKVDYIQNIALQVRPTDTQAIIDARATELKAISEDTFTWSPWHPTSVLMAAVNSVKYLDGLSGYEFLKKFSDSTTGGLYNTRAPD